MNRVNLSAVQFTVDVKLQAYFVKIESGEMELLEILNSSEF